MAARKCKTPGKKPYRYEGEAKRAARDAGQNYGRPMEHYECECGRWHISLIKIQYRRSDG